LYPLKRRISLETTIIYNIPKGMYQKRQTEINPFEADASTKKINELERKVEEIPRDSQREGDGVMKTSCE
jgi:hypothetical protein